MLKIYKSITPILPTLCILRKQSNYTKFSFLISTINIHLVVIAGLKWSFSRLETLTIPTPNFSASYT